MSVDIPSDCGAIVQQLVADGKFKDEGEVVAEGIRLVIARESLRADIQAGIDELDAGSTIDAGGVYAEARRRISFDVNLTPNSRETARSSRRA